MREIKFRAWDIDKNEMTFFDLYALSCCEDYLYGPLISGVSRSGKNLEIMQFTGLHDKNGKEIYESDIVSDVEDGTGWRAEVIYEDGAFCIKMLDEMPKTHPHDVLCEYNDHIECEDSKFEHPLTKSK